MVVQNKISSKRKIVKIFTMNILRPKVVKYFENENNFVFKRNYFLNTFYKIVDNIENNF